MADGDRGRAQGGPAARRPGPDGTDAVARLRREHEVLDRLAGIPGVPAGAPRGSPCGSTTSSPWSTCRARRWARWLAPQLPADPPQRAPTPTSPAYTERALALLDAGRARSLAEVHGAASSSATCTRRTSWSTTTTDRVSLIDFELASDAADGARPALGAPGFRAGRRRTGIEIDEHALAALRLWFFLPLTPLLELAPGKLRGSCGPRACAASRPRGYADRSSPALAPRAGRRPDTGTRRSRARLGARAQAASPQAILASATPERTDRLFPGDIEPFRLGGACFGYGAAGVLHALTSPARAGSPSTSGGCSTPCAASRRSGPASSTARHGIAYVLDDVRPPRRGGRAAGRRRRPSVAQTTDHGLASGLAGIGLTRLHLAARRRDSRRSTGSAVTIGVRLARRRLSTARRRPGEVGRAGLHDGWSGPALLFIRLYELTGDALVARTTPTGRCDAGPRRVRDHRRRHRCRSATARARTLPYVGVGSAGIAVVAGSSRGWRSGFACQERVPGLRDACRARVLRPPGLFYGRAGLMTALAAHGAVVRVRGHAPGPARLARRALQGGLAFPGNQLLRLSMDVATGGAGVLLALAAVLDGQGGCCRSSAAAPSPPDLRPLAGGEETRKEHTWNSFWSCRRWRPS